MIISFGGSFPYLSGGGALNVRRCLTPADKAVRVRMVGTGWKADAVDKIAKPNNNKISWAQQALYSDRIVSIEMGECRTAYPAGSAVLIGLNPLGFTVVAVE
eukprot:scaffold4389_cov44-Cyclotella_meneghiniana.AAC.2